MKHNPDESRQDRPAEEIPDLSGESPDPSSESVISSGVTDVPLQSNVPDGQPGDDPSPAIRVGSPFAVDPLQSRPKRPAEPFYDVGPIRYTAMGSIAASIMVLFFAAVAAWWFPSGGALIAALGCVLSIFGMYSAFRITAVSLLALHLTLFVLSYGRSIG